MLDAKDVLSKVDIVDVIRSYIPIQTKGKSLKAICPFHDDHDPSLSISREKQIFKCFTCGTGGDAIRFVQLYENISFKEALEKVARDFAHMEIKPSQTQEKPKFTDKEMRWFQAHETAASYANYCLRTEAGKEALSYLTNRHMDMDRIDQYQIGYIPDEKQFHAFLNSKGFSDQELKDAGILEENGRCMFQHRIVFPIKNIHNRICGFTSRRIHEDGTAKYINSRESNIFQKSQLMYHLPEALKTGRNVFLVEGTMDVAGLSRIGNNSGIAPLGTALTKEHVQGLKHAKANVTLCYDGDKAGRQATIKNYHIMKQAGVTPKIVIMPDGVDPDELSMKDPKRLEELLSKGNTIYDFYLKTMPQFENFQEKQEFILNYMKDLIQEDILMQEEYLKRLSDKVDYDLQSLKTKMHSMKPSEATKKMVRKEYQKPQNSSKQKPIQKKDKALIRQNVKDRMEFKKEVRINYDRLANEQGKVTVFDNDKVIQNRSEILEKYLYVNGPVLDAQITLLEGHDQADFHAQAVCEETIKAFCEENKIAKANINYIAFLHKDTTYPHVHLQIWQKEPYLAKYEINNNFFKHLQSQINEVMEKPVDYTNNPLIAEEMESMFEDISMPIFT